MVDPSYSEAMRNFSFKELGQAPTRDLLYSGVAAATPMLGQEPEFDMDKKPSTIRPYRYDLNRTNAERDARTSDTGERTYFRPQFTPLKPYTANNGGIVALNAGGMPAAAQAQTPSRFLRGSGDGVSDSIPASINQGERPAALSDGEYVIDARGVAEIGNGSSMAGAKKLNSMMSRIHNARKSAGKGEDMNADRFLFA